MRLRMQQIRIAIASLIFLSHSVAYEDQAFDGLDGYVADVMERWDVSGAAVAIVTDGRVVVCRGYGTTHDEGTIIDADSPFALASITKNFTAAALGILVQDGKLDWDDPVKQYLPEVEFHDEYLSTHITIRDLLAHRTGLEPAGALFYRGDLSSEQIVRRLRFLQPRCGFRERFEYNNLMYIVAARVVETVSGSSYSTFIQKNIFLPLGMNSTATTHSLPATESAIVNQLIDGRVVASHFEFSGGEGAAGLQSTADDMSQWLLENLNSVNPQILEPEVRRHMQAIHMTIPVDADRLASGNPYKAQFVGHGLGWSVHDYRGKKLCYHAGSTGTVFAVIPEQDIGVVVLTNLDFSNAAIALMYAILDAHALGPNEKWSKKHWPLFLKDNLKYDPRRRADIATADAKRKKGTNPTLPAPRYAGSYSCDLYGDLRVTESNGSLIFKFGSNPPVASTHWEKDTFYLRRPMAEDSSEDWFVTFEVTGDPLQSRALSIQPIGWNYSMPGFERDF